MKGKALSPNQVQITLPNLSLKTYIPVQIEIIKGLTDKGQFQYLTGLTGPQKGT